MSILIKGMEMPTSCETCAFTRLSNTGESIYCCIDYDTVPWGDGLKSENCPLVPVPPHGRLIEAEPIVKYVTDGLNSGELGYDAIKVMTEIEYAPTIIPAEEGE